MKKRILSMLLVLVMVLGMFPMSAMAAEDPILKIDGEYEIVTTYTGYYDAPTFLVRVPTDTTSVKLNITEEYACITSDYDSKYDFDSAEADFFTFELSDDNPGLPEGEMADWIPEEYLAYCTDQLYFLAFCPADMNSDIVDVIFYKSDIPVHGGDLEDESVLKIDGAHEVIAEFIGYYDAPTFLVRVPTDTTSVKLNITEEYACITSDYDSKYDFDSAEADFFTFELSNDNPGLPEGQIADWVPEEYIAYCTEPLYFIAFCPLDLNSDIVDVIFYKSDVPVHGGDSDAVDKTELNELISSIRDDTTVFYTENDRWNGISYDSNGHWKTFISSGKREQAIAVANSDSIPQAIVNQWVDSLRSDISTLIPTNRVNATELYEVLSTDWYWVWSSVDDDNQWPAISASNTTAVTWDAYAAAKTEAEALLDSLYDTSGAPTDVNTAAKQADVDRLTEAADPRELLVKLDTYTEAYETYKSRRAEAQALLEQYDPAKLTESNYSTESWEAYEAAYEALAADLDHTFLGGNKADNTVVQNFTYHIDTLRTARKQLASTVDVTVSITYVNAYAAKLPVSHEGYEDLYTGTMTLTGGSSTLADAYTKLPVYIDFEAKDKNLLPNGYQDECDTNPLFAVYINGEGYGTVNVWELTDPQSTNVIQLHDGDDVVLMRVLTPMAQGEASTGTNSSAIYDHKAQEWEYQHSYGMIDMTAPTGTVKVGDKVSFSAAVTGASAQNMGQALSAENISLFVSEAGENEELAQPTNMTTALTDAGGKLKYVFTEPGWYTVAMLNVQDDVYTFTDIFRATTYGEYYSLYAGDWAMVYVAPADNEDAVLAQYRTENLAKAKTYFEQFHDYDFEAGYYEETFKAQYDALIANQNSAENFTDLMAKFDEDFVKLQEYGANAIAHDTVLAGLRENMGYIPADLSTMDSTYAALLTEIQTVYAGLNAHQKSLLTGHELARLDAIAAVDVSALPVPADVALAISGGSALPFETQGYGVFSSASNHNKAFTVFPDGSMGEAAYKYAQIEEPAGLGTVKAGQLLELRRYIHQSGENHWLMYSVDGGTTWEQATHYVPSLSEYYDSSVARVGEYFIVNYTVPTGIDALEIKLDMYSEFELEAWQEAKDAAGLAEVKASAISALEDAYAGYDKSKYDEDGLAALEKALNDGKAAINAANTNVAVNEARKAALAAMASVPKKATGTEQKPQVGFDSGDTVGQVHVLIENQTFHSGLKKLDGVYVDDWFDLGENDTMMTVVLKALRSKGYTWNGTKGTFNPDGSMDYESTDLSDYTITYLASVVYGDDDNSLSEFDGGAKSGWMGTLNEWFVHEGFQGFSVDNGKLENGDEIHVMYTCAYGADIDGSWSSTDTSLAELSISSGTLTPAFDSATTDYILLISGDRANVKVQPVPTNKNYQHRIFLNDYNSDSAYYKRTETISVTSGDVIYVGVGESGWPTMNSGGRPTKYTIEVYTLADAIEALPAESAVALSNYKSYKETATLLRSTISKQGYSGDTSKLVALEEKIQFYSEIDNVKSLLNAIPAASQLKTSDKSKVVAAQNAYEKLSEEQQLYITVADVAKYNAAVEWLEEHNIVIPGGTISGADKAPEEVTVPISGEQNSIDVAVTVDGTKATISEVDMSDLGTVIGDKVSTGTVTIDFSGLESDEAITTVELPADTVKKIAEAVNDPKNDAHSLEIVLSDGASIEFDAAALKEKASQAKGEDITISIESHENVKLTNAQKKALGDRPAFDINVTSGGKHISDMGGKITVHAPYVLKGDEKARGIVVWYVDDNGNKERCVTSYDPIKKRVNWKTDHLSLYMIDYDETLANNPFTDVTMDNYYFDAVLWAVDEGITNGTSDSTFSPDASCTRAQMVTFLWRAAGSPKATVTTCAFTDVDKDAYYYEALLWAVENGITSGTSATTFSPNASCTRGQMATFLYRDAKSPAVTGTHAFTDVKADAYYNNAVIWAAAEGITVGTSDTTFSPDADCTRAQMVTFLWRYLAK